MIQRNGVRGLAMVLALVAGTGCVPMGGATSPQFPSVGSLGAINPAPGTGTGGINTGTGGNKGGSNANANANANANELADLRARIAAREAADYAEFERRRATALSNLPDPEKAPPKTDTAILNI